MDFLQGLFIGYLASNPFFYVSWVGLLAFSICLHEYAHAFTALKLGDDTAARSGHLSLNPLVQMGGTALLCLAVAGIGWGSVPVSPARYRSRRDWALVAFSGPAANLLLSAVFAVVTVLLLHLAPSEGVWDLAARFFQIGCAVNATFFIFNLLPVPIFDGWAVFSLLVPAMDRIDPRQANQVAWFVLLLVFLTPVGDVIWGLGFGLGDLFMRAAEGLLPL